MLSVLVPCYFCFTSKLKKLLYIFFVFPDLVLNIWNWAGVFSLRKKKKKFEYYIQLGLSSISAGFFQVLNIVLHKKTSCKKILCSSELAGYHCPVTNPTAMAKKNIPMMHRKTLKPHGLVYQLQKGHH